MVIECFGWRSPIECLAGSGVEGHGDGLQV
jgi:hypothetical protein